MQTATKASLLSALLFPGLGQIYLKRYWRGIIIMLVAMSGLGVIVGMAILRALEIVKSLQGQGPIDVNALSAMALEPSPGDGSTLYTLMLLLLAGCWLFSIVDAYRIGKETSKRDEQNHER